MASGSFLSRGSVRVCGSPALARVPANPPARSPGTGAVRARAAFAVPCRAPPAAATCALRRRHRWRQQRKEI